MQVVLTFRSYLILFVLLSIVGCVSDSTIKNTTESETPVTPSVAKVKEVPQQQAQAAPSPSEQIGAKTTALTQNPALQKPKKATNPVNPQSNKKVVDQAKEQLKELEAKKGQLSAGDYARKKQSIQGMIDNPEKFVSKLEPTPAQLNTLPNACDLLSDNFIAKTVGVDAASITVKDGTGASSEHARACFFRWDHKGVANSGVLIQIQENPLPGEIDNWAAYYIQAKVNQGETNPTTMESTRFKAYNDIGVSGAYNYNMHRYLWRTDNDKVFMIAFNIKSSEKEELAWAKTLGEEIMRNYRP